VTLSKLLAPFTPFLAEELYQNLVCSVFPDAPESVHLTDFPIADETKIDKQLMADIQLAMKVSSLGRADRSEKGIKVRQPLPNVTLTVPSSSEKEVLERLGDQIREELNVKHFTVAIDAGLGLSAKMDINLTPELKAEGIAREIVRYIQTMRRAAGFDIADHIVTCYQGDDYIKGVMTDKTLAEYIKQETLSQKLIDGVPEEGAFTERQKISGYEVLLGVKRLG